MYGSGYIFGKGFFEAWIIVSIMWVWGTMLVAGFFPIIDGWEQLRSVRQGLVSLRKV
jgi:urea-proton symporter